jgi:flavin reductase (DIM6/NTAB) family NADH-FMN oxidoreductase RutF
MSATVDVDVDVQPTRLRRVLSASPTGVTALAAVVDGKPVGLVANSFTSVSLDPPLVSVCVATSSGTWPLLRGVGRIGASVLSHRQEAASRRLSGGGRRERESTATAGGRNGTVDLPLSKP